MINPKNLLRGSVWLVDLNPTVGHEQSEKRPCLVISADSYNQGLAGLVLVLPITSRQRELFWFVPLNLLEGGLELKSYVICDQLRSVALQRFSPKCLGFVNDSTLALVDQRLRVLLNIFS